MNLVKYFQLVIVATWTFSGLAYGSVPAQKIIKEIDQTDLQKLERGEHILKRKKVEGSSWPELTIYALIDASPLESVAIFAAYDYQKEYIPNLLESRPWHVTPTEVHVNYVLKMPWPLANGKYVHGHQLKSPAKGEYEVEWFMVKSNSAETVRGRAQFYHYKGKTLMKYVTFVNPKSFFAGIFKKLMVKDVVKSINAIIQTTEKSRLENPTLLNKYTGYITRALKGNKVYKLEK